MAININGTEVISDILDMTNVQGTVNSRISDRVSPIINELSGFEIVMTHSAMHKTVVSNSIFTVNNASIAQGRSSILLIECGGVDLTWPTNFHWSEVGEPVWSEYRYWVVTLMCFDNNNVICNAFGHDAIISEVVSINDQSLSNNISGVTRRIDYNINSNGEYLFILQNVTASAVLGFRQGTWVTPTPPVGSYWVRITPTSAPSPSGDSTNTWLPLSSSRAWTWFVSDNISSFNIEISASDGGAVLDSASFTASVGNI